MVLLGYRTLAANTAGNPNSVSQIGICSKIFQFLLGVSHQIGMGHGDMFDLILDIANEWNRLHRIY